MLFYFNMKALGKKRAYIQKKAIELDVQSNCKLTELLSLIVRKQVEEFNSRKAEQNLVHFFSEGQIEQAQTRGSVKFNENYNDTKADVNKAIGAVLQAFEDGLIAVFINDVQHESLEESIELKEEDTLSIIRLSFLTGTLF